MGNQSNSREQRLFLVPEVTYGRPVAPVPTDAVLFERFTLGNGGQIITRRDKTGSRGTRSGSKGHESCQWSFEGGLTPNPVPGSKPALNALLLAGFGAVATGAADVTYTLASAIKSFAAWDYRTPTTMAARCGAGLVVGSLAFQLGGDYLTVSAGGEGRYCIYSDLFAGLDAEHKCGLAAFAPEPESEDVSDDGGIVVSFMGSLAVAGQTIASIQSASSRLSTANNVRRDTVGKWIPDGTEGGTRFAATSFLLYDEDTAEVSAVRQAAEDKTPVDVIMVVGFANAARFEFTHKNVQLANSSLDDSGLRWKTSVGDSQASESTPGANDEYQLRIY